MPDDTRKKLITSIVGLDFISGPAAILGTVVAIAVYSIKGGVFLSVFFAMFFIFFVHILIKIFKHIPPGAGGNSLFVVVFIRLFLTTAPQTHTKPYPMETSSRKSVPSSSTARRLSSKTTTTFGFSAPYFKTVRTKHSPTGALKQPPRLRRLVFFNKRNACGTIVSLACHVYKSTHALII